MMNGSYALIALLTVYLVYLMSRYLSVYSMESDSQSNSTQVNGTLFVALIQRENSPSINIKSIRETWLQQVDNHVFSEKEGTWRGRSKIRFPPSIRGDVSQLRWIAAYVNEILKSQASWFIVTTDKTYVIIKNLMPLLPNTKTPAYSFIENPKYKTFHMLVLNRSAMKFLSKAYSLNICGYKTLHNCLRLGKAQRFKIDRDENGLKRYHVLSRHMDMNELKKNTRNGQYFDGGQEFHKLSNFTHSFHNLLAKEIIWYHTMIHGVSH